MSSFINLYFHCDKKLQHDFSARLMATISKALWHWPRAPFARWYNCMKMNSMTLHVKMTWSSSGALDSLDMKIFSIARSASKWANLQGCLAKLATDTELDAADSQFKPYPTACFVCTLGCALVVWPAMLFQNNSAYLKLWQTPVFSLRARTPEPEKCKICCFESSKK